MFSALVRDTVFLKVCPRQGAVLSFSIQIERAPLRKNYL
ncbi:hypothetical protein CIB84_001025 [Bambusicola thoracicus]|uniref:Uncharacterized protein n=1 Tax=Bambusicola thoracicus TaxID=9083 RepID=A0A2P4TFR7_BAMTH|nr:hypothetical protein CIB84_001025 [Bambusicola thoracicus]